MAQFKLTKKKKQANKRRFQQKVQKYENAFFGDLLSDEKFKKRFLAKFNVGKKNECWEWLAVKSQQNGYGRISFKSKMVKAHRISYMLANNETCINHKLVTHTCDNPPCINPNHLKLSTHSENNKQAYTRNRIDRSKLGYHNPIKLELTKKIYNLYIQGFTITQISKKVNLSFQTIDVHVKKYKKLTKEFKL